MTYTVKYQYGTYSGTVDVNAAPDDDNDTIIAKAKTKLRPHMTLPMAHESWRIVGRDGND